MPPAALIRAKMSAGVNMAVRAAALLFHADGVQVFSCSNGAFMSAFAHGDALIS